MIFDELQVHPLKENGENIAVTHENKHEYVELYVDFLLNKSVEKQFKPFNQGFQKVRIGLFNFAEIHDCINKLYKTNYFEIFATVISYLATVTMLCPTN